MVTTNLQKCFKIGFGKRKPPLSNVFKRPLFNSLPSDKGLDQSNLKDFADDKINVTYVTNFVLRRVENIVGKGKYAGYQHFLLFTPLYWKIGGHINL